METRARAHRRRHAHSVPPVSPLPSSPPSPHTPTPFQTTTATPAPHDLTTRLHAQEHHLIVLCNSQQQQFQSHLHQQNHVLNHLLTQLSILQTNLLPFSSYTLVPSPILPAAPPLPSTPYPVNPHTSFFPASTPLHPFITATAYPPPLPTTSPYNPPAFPSPPTQPPLTSVFPHTSPTIPTHYSSHYIPQHPTNHIPTASYSTAKPPPKAKFDCPRFATGDPTDWIFAVEQYFDYHQIPYRDQLKVAAIHLDKPASRWYHSFVKGGLLID